MLSSNNSTRPLSSHRSCVWLLPYLFPSQIPVSQGLRDAPNIHNALWSWILMCLLTPVMIFQNIWATNCYHALLVFTVIPILKQTQPFLMILYLLADSLACVYLNSCWAFFQYIYIHIYSTLLKRRTTICRFHILQKRFASIFMGTTWPKPSPSVLPADPWCAAWLSMLAPST